MARLRSIPAAARVVAAAVALAITLPACGGAGPVISSDPAAPIYRAPDARFAELKGVTFRFGKVKTSDGQGIELVTAVFGAELRGSLPPRFGTASEGPAAPPGGALLEVAVDVDWGNRAARYFAMGSGGGQALVTIDYELRDAAGTLLARARVGDRMSGGAFGGNAKDLVHAAAAKWDRWLVEQLLVDPAKTTTH